ncbi:MAG: hypothetical protein EOO43_00255 [Flavobacterium sp.]|nr:MAG: hypothetical protein EOO43_00255 [Flavobacterium sp.]
MVIKIKSLKGLSKQQEQIHRGLFQIGNLLGSFYLDALMILSSDCMLTTKVNLLAHLAREIDGGFKDVFAPKDLKAKKEATMTGEKNGNYAAILVALGFDQPEIAEEWLSISKNFHQLAHRHEVWLNPKDFNEMNVLWVRYEKILSILTGSAYAFRDRIKHITSLQKPSREILGALENLLRDKQNEVQFFRNLSSAKWLRPLYDKGIFQINQDNAFIQENGKLIVKDWLPLQYLVNISKIAGRHEQILIVKIIEQLKEDILSDKLLLDDYSLLMLLEVIKNLKDYHFDEGHTKILDKYNLESKDQQRYIYSSVLTEGLLSKYIKEGNKNALHTLLLFCFGFYVIEESTLFLEELGVDVNRRIVPKVESIAYYSFENKLKDITRIDGEDLLAGLSEVISSLSKEKPYDLDSIPSIEKSEQTEMHVHDWSAALVNFFRDIAEQLQHRERDVLISKLFASNTQILQRVGIHLVRLNYKESGTLFWEWIRKEKLSALFNIHEIFLLLNQYSGEMSIEEIIEVATWIENIFYDPAIFNTDDLNNYKFFRIRQHLEAMKPSNEKALEYVKNLKDKYAALSPGEFPHPEFDGYSSSGFPNDPIDGLEDFSDKTFEQQIQFLVENLPSGYFDMKARSLGILLNNNIISDPKKYTSEIDRFKDLPVYFQSFFISANTAIATNGNYEDWPIISSQLISTLSLDSWRSTGDKSDQLQTLTDSAEFFLQLSNKPEYRDISGEEIDKILKFLIKICNWDYFKSTDHVNSNDYRNHYINSMQGRAFDALVNWGKIWGEKYSTEENKIHPRLKQYIESNIDRTTEMDKDFSLGLGYHFSYLLLVDSEWFQHNKDRVLPIHNKLHMSYTMGAMFFSFMGVSKRNVDFIRVNGLNKYAAEDYAKHSWETQTVVRFALSEYYWNRDIIDDKDSLLGKILENGSPKQYLKIIDLCVEMQHFTKEDGIKLWEMLLEKSIAKKGEYEDVLRILPNLVRITKFTEKTIDLAEVSLPYLSNDSATYRLIHSLVNVEIGAQPKSAELILKIWKKTKLPVYVSKELASLVESLFSMGNTEIAFEICDYAGENGDMSLKGIYDKYKLIGLKTGG